MTERQRPPDLVDTAERLSEARRATETPHPGIRAIFFSAVTTEACEQFAKLGPGYWAFFTADPNPAYTVTDEQIAKAMRGGGKIGAWCDCDKTPIDVAMKMADDRDLDGVCGQFETNEQWDDYMHSIAAHYASGGGTPFGAIGNPSALNADNLAEARNHPNPLIGEVMYPDPTYSAQGVNIASACYYVDRDEAQGGYLPLKAYEVMPEAQRRTCSVYTGGVMTTEDWRLYAEWTKP